MPAEHIEELAARLSEFGYRETDDSDRRRYYKVEKWDDDEQHVVELIHASNNLTRARLAFRAQVKSRPRGRYILRQNIRVLDRWPPPLS
jgi:hypothetical protein